MNKPFLFLVSLLAFCIIGTAQYTQQITNVRAQARIFADATIKKDYKTVLKYTNLEGFPKGKLNAMTEPRVLKILQTADAQMVEQGRSIQSIQFGAVLSILKVDYELQCTLEQITQTKMQYGSIITKSTLLAISEDNGVTWKYTDATGRDLNDMKKIMPRLSNKLVFEKAEAPQFIKDPTLKK